MPTSDDASLILGNGEQLALMPDEALDAIGLPAVTYLDTEARGRFTGERLFFTNPKLYRAITRMIARGDIYREIAELCEVSLNTVCGVARREDIPIESIRERIGRTGLEVAQLSLEAMREILIDPVLRAKLTLKDLAIAHGIATTNAQLLLGGATARVETNEITAPGHDDYQRMLDEAAAEVRRREINVTSTGLGAENPALKEGDGGAVPSAADSPSQPVESASQLPDK